MVFVHAGPSIFFIHCETLPRGAFGRFILGLSPAPKREIYDDPSFLREISPFSQIKEAPRRLLSASTESQISSV